MVEHQVHAQIPLPVANSLDRNEKISGFGILHNKPSLLASSIVAETVARFKLALNHLRVCKMSVYFGIEAAPTFI